MKIIALFVLVVLLNLQIAECQQTDNKLVDGTIRLIGGRNQWEGTIEIYHNGSWGTICDDSIDINDGNVICRSLGYLRAIQVFGNAHFGQGINRVVIGDLLCTGAEQNISSCPVRRWYTSDCTHLEDAGVMCYRGNTNNTVEEVKLINGIAPYTGVVQLKINGIWGTICQIGFDINDANVICKMAGYSRAIGYGTARGIGDVFVSNLKCDGSEENIDMCIHDGWYILNCDHSSDASVTCLNGKTEVRLVGGTGPYEGTIELNVNNEWGSICGYQFDISDGNVICRMVGYPRAIQVFYGAYFGQGYGDVFFGNLHCGGDEKSVDNCTAGVWQSTCLHNVDAGVSCLSSNRTSTVQGVRLVNGSASWEGRIELKINDRWGTVCGHKFNLDDGNVICHMAGFERALNVYNSDHFGAGIGSVYVSDLDCSGTEYNVDDCGGVLWPNDCTHDNDVGITCQKRPLNVLPPQVQLQTSKTFPSGTTQVEIPCFVEGIPEPTVVWKAVDRPDLPPNSYQFGHFLVFHNVTSTNEGRYSCTARNINGTATKIIRITVTALAPQIQLIDGKTISVGTEHIEIPCFVEGIPEPTVVWKALDRPVLPSNSYQSGHFLVFHNVTDIDTGRYSCTAQNVKGTVTKTIQISVSAISTGFGKK